MGQIFEKSLAFDAVSSMCTQEPSTLVQFDIGF